MATTNIPQSLLGINLGDIVTDLIPEGILPGFVTDAIKSTVDVILDPNDDSIKPGDPQPAGERPIPTTDPEELSAAVKAIDGALAGIALVLKFRFLVPDKFEGPLEALAGALRTIRGWLD